MTVKELIEQLQTLDQDSRVFVRGYEAGYDDINSVKTAQIVLNVNNVWYYGKHDTLERENKRDRILNKDTTRESIEGIIIGYDENYSSTR
jgi:hypothetical protein